jgi:hypothetical protein
LEEQAKAIANTQKLNNDQKMGFDTILEAIYTVTRTLINAVFSS